MKPQEINGAKFCTYCNDYTILPTVHMNRIDYMTKKEIETWQCIRCLRNYGRIIGGKNVQENQERD